ncbi:hypothetical protein Q8A73_009923 [Channa argus]|nr:hypothetical protein Q8A73_009923 [Channa argus]
MAEETYGRTLDQLKRERTTAKSCFTRQANYLIRKARYMTKSDLKEEFAKLSVATKRVMEANDEYRTGLLVDMESKSDGSTEVQLDDQLEFRFEKVTIECELRFDEAKKSVQVHLWANYGLAEMTAAFEEAQRACEYASSIAGNQPRKVIDLIPTVEKPLTDLIDLENIGAMEKSTEVELEELWRPEEIDLLISHREGRLAPQRVKADGDLVLLESPPGKTVGGTHPDLFEQWRPVIQLLANGSSRNGGNRTASVQHVSQNVVADAVLTAKQEDVCLKVDRLGSVMEPKLNCSSYCDSPLCFIHSGVNRQEGLDILQRLCSLRMVISL